MSLNAIINHLSMTDEEIEKAAQAHAEQHFVDNALFYSQEPWDKASDHYAKTLADFAKQCISKQWVSVEERLPDPNTTCLVFGHQDFGDGRLTRYTMLAYYDGEGFYDAYNDGKYHPSHWMPIPIPPLNPKKEER